MIYVLVNSLFTTAKKKKKTKKKRTKDYDPSSFFYISSAKKGDINKFCQGRNKLHREDVCNMFECARKISSTWYLINL